MILRGEDSLIHENKNREPVSLYFVCFSLILLLKAKTMNGHKSPFQPNSNLPSVFIFRCRLVNLLMVIFLFGCTFNSLGQKVAQFSFEETSGTLTTIDSITHTYFNVTNHFNRPQKIQGINGYALRLDGYSTWASNGSYQLNGITNEMTIEAWFSTEAFTKENAAIVSQIAIGTGFALEIGSYGNVILEFYADGTKYTIQTNQKIEKYKWNYIVALIDLPNAKARILVNGSEWASQNIANQTNITLSNTTMFLGRHNNDIEYSGFLLTALNGAIDEVTISQNIVSDSVINANYLTNASKIPDLTIDPNVRYAGDFLRPRYHAMPNADWTNESYGLTYYNGKYHLFFQKNPNGPYLYFMHWGHLISNDLVNWTEGKIALAPSPGFDSFGVWSGSTMLDSTGMPNIFYTGVDGVKAGIGKANATDTTLEYWTKNPSNPLIPSPPAGYVSMDFRDPFLWKYGNTYYMIVGSGIQNNGGGILFTYKSNDQLHWTSISPLYRSSNTLVSGIFWEMPFFFHLHDNIYILGVTPVPTQTKPAETLYWIGTWVNEKFTPFNSTPNKLELINGKLLSPSFSLDEANRITYLGIVPEDRDVNAQIQAEWRHMFSLPRVVRLLKDSLIGQVPHPNLCRLRYNEISMNDTIILPGSGFNLPKISGNQIELFFRIKADSASKFSIQVLKNLDALEFTSIVFDLSQNIITCDRSHSSLSNTTKDIRSANYIFDFHDTINIKIFIDHSIVEVFVDDLAAFSCRVYPSREESQKVDFIVNTGRTEITELKKWQLFDMNSSTSKDVCELTSLPDSFRTIKIATTVKEVAQNIDGVHVFPNPTNNILFISYEKPLQNIFINVWDVNGKEIINESLKNKDLLNNLICLNVSNLSNGVYFLNLASKNQVYSTKFMISR